MLMLVTVPSSSLSSMNAVVARTVAVLDDFDVHVRWIVGDDDENNDDEDNDATADIYWRDATPLYGGSLYRQERFVIKDALSAMMATTTMGATGTAATASSSTAFYYDVVMALYRDDVEFLSNDILHEYLRTSRRLLLDSKNDHATVVPHLPLVVSPNGAAAAAGTTTTPDVMDHPARGLTRVYNDTTSWSSIAATSTTTVPPLWGWMATPEQLFLSYRRGNFPLPPFDEAVAMNHDDALYVLVVSRIAIVIIVIPDPLFVFAYFCLYMHNHHCMIHTAGNAVLITVCRSYCPSTRNDNDAAASVTSPASGG
jgi:hypothetical protein